MSRSMPRSMSRSCRPLRLQPLFRLVLLALAAAGLLLGGAAAAGAATLSGGGGDGGELFGEPLRETTAVRVGELLEDPEAYVGQRLQIVGLVEDVCPMKGCWVEIVERQGSQPLRFKVQDDVIVFPATAKGRQIVAEGVLTVRELEVEEARGWLAHLAEERGEEFDPATVTEPLRLYEVRGEGAELGPAGE
ncbi:MAG: DUF4920 domain-containing protein [Acidobacteria bacterium]|nr:MAG: DUF4920 domain-containing protein [Acidobacteriota bacterium]REK05878.1 MAG: DUF4920 domain-containing protein [Acidobacteriota bacterium]